MNPAHSPHCRACKERIRDLLSAAFGDCRINHRFPWSSYPEDYLNTPIGNHLEQIRRALGELRGHRDFIKSAQMPPCDYFVTDPPFIVEFDEDQHFSRARLVTLSLYPKDRDWGFSLPRWLDLCAKIDAVDDTPIDRDERRAWYDTLRDLVPLAHGFNPTVRLYAGEFDWCKLDTGASTVRNPLKELLGDRLRDGIQA